MFVRVRRAIAQEHASTGAVLRTYSPEAVAGVAAAGMGAAGVGSGSTMVRMPDGQLRSALGEAVDGVMRWGRREQRRYLRLPARVLVLAVPEAIDIYAWTAAGGQGARAARWERGTFAAAAVHYLGEQGVRVTDQHGRIALLTGRRGPLHPAVRRTLHAVLDTADNSDRTSRALSSPGQGRRRSAHRNAP